MTPIGKVLLGLSLLLASIGTARAGFVHDYRGTLGTQKIGLAIDTPSGDIVPGKINFVSGHYFYDRYLKDIALKLKSQNGRDVVFEEYGPGDKLVGTFSLSFATQDPQNHFHDKNGLVAEVLVGNWESADAKTTYPVYLSMEDSVSASEDGGRCDLTGAQYQTLQAKVERFRAAVIKGDEAVLKRDFHFDLSGRAADRQTIVDAVPHDLFCNYQGFMLDRGVVWFDDKGMVINGDSAAPHAKASSGH